MANFKMPAVPWTPLCVGVRDHLADMSGAEAKVYLALRTRQNTQTGQLNPTNATLAADCNLHSDVVSAALTKLAARGLIERHGPVFKRWYSIPDIAIGSAPSRGIIGKTKHRVEEPSDGRNVGRVPDKTSGHFPDDSSEQSRSNGTENKRTESQDSAASPLAGLTAGVLSPSPLQGQIVQSGSDHQSVSITPENDEEYDDSYGYVPPSTAPSLAATSETLQKPAAANGRASAAVKTSSRSSKAGKARKSRLAGLDLDAATSAKVCATLEDMTLWLTYGTEAITRGSAEGLHPIETNWRVNRFPDGSIDAQKMTAMQWVGFYWYRVCRYRVSVGLPLMALLPSDFEQMEGGIKSLCVRLGGAPEKVFRFIDILTANFDAIRVMINWPNLALSDRSLNNPTGQLLDAVDQLAAMSDADRSRLVDDLLQQVA